MRSSQIRRGALTWAVVVLVATTSVAAPAPLSAQDTGGIRGTVTRADDGAPLRDVAVGIQSTSLHAVTDAAGHFAIPRAPAGAQLLVVRWIGFQPKEVPVQVVAGRTQIVDVALAARPILLSDVLVQSVSRSPERVVDAPAAVGVVDANVARAISPTAQLPLALERLAGVDVVQSDVADFNVNARGFNTTFTRRILVLQDGRDLSIAFIGSQEWNALSLPLEDMSRIEMVRGPGSALYGANAFSGVLNLTTPAARDVVGTKLAVAGGDLDTHRGDLRQAGVFGDGRFGYRANIGYSSSDMWSRSRTNIGDLAREYASAIDTSRYHVNTPFPGFELVPLVGQTKPGPPGTPASATGRPDDLTSLYGSARLDYYGADGSITTLEAGDADVKNEVYVSAIGRFQFTEAVRPWARLAYASDHWNLMAWSSGRRSLGPQQSLASGAFFSEVSSLSHVEAQYNGDLFGTRGHYVVGGSGRLGAVDSKQTLISPEDDNRQDHYYSAYGQLEYRLAPRVRVSGAARVDGSNLFATQFSPKLSLLVQLSSRESFHLTVNRAFQTPSTLQYFVKSSAGPPADFSQLEAGLRASPLGPALAGVPQGTLFTNSSAVPLWVFGNKNLKVESVIGVDLGYKRQIGSRVFITVDGYYSQVRDFVTDVLAGVNPAYAPWTAPAQVPVAQRAAVEGAVRGALAAGPQPDVARALTRLKDGSTAVVFSVGNAGHATVSGVEIGAAVQLSNEWRADANITLDGFSVDSAGLVPGARVLPNTPHRKANASLMYEGRNGMDGWLAARLVSDYDWASGVWMGRIPPSTTVDASLGWQVVRDTRLHLTVTNLLDQERYLVYGGSLIGRRVIGGVTVTF
jgi:outer membrane receptor protein involved in Fe transport